MPAFLANPRLKKILTYTFAYLLFAILALLGLWVTTRLHSSLYHLFVLFGLQPNVAGGLYTISAALLFLGYAVFIGVLEPYMNKAAKTGQVLRRSGLVFAIEGVLFLLTLIILSL